MQNATTRTRGYSTGAPKTLAKPRTEPARVLVAEDDIEMRRLLYQAFRADGHHVVTAGSGLELFDELRRQRLEGCQPDVVVSDIRMPGLTGIELLACIRAWGWEMPVVLMTAFGDEKTFAEATRLGGNVLFTKPFDVDDLRTAVMCLLA